MDNKPKKLIRDKIIEKLEPGEWEVLELVGDREELDKLFELKIEEEVREVKSADFKDINEFADLIEVVCGWADSHGFKRSELFSAYSSKFREKGQISNTVLTNLNPNNPSNELYFM